MAETTLSNNLEQEIAQIEQALAEKRSALKQQQESGELTDLPHDKEFLREIMHEKISSGGGDTDQTLPHHGNASPPAPAPAPPTHQTTLQDPAGAAQIQELVNTAFNKSIDDAIKAVKATHNAALIDAFHDVLVDELYDHLVERGKLQRF